jgi:hypothetical protein
VDVLEAATNELQTAALFVKGRATRANGDLIGRFHLQIAASGGASTIGGEDELFRKIRTSISTSCAAPRTRMWPSRSAAWAR